MIEKIVRDYLKTKLNVPVYLEIPANPSDKYVFIEKTAGGETDHIESATLAIKSVSAKSLYDSAELNETVKNAMRHIIDTTGVMKCKLNSDYNYTDTSKKNYRYQAVFNLTY